MFFLPKKHHNGALNVQFTRLSVFFAFFLFLFHFSLLAQTDSTVLNAVVIQATRVGNNSPVPHSNFSKKAIAATLQAQDIPFLLTSVPSLVETSDAGAGVGYTGLRIRGSDPTRVNVTINGVPLNDAESQGVFWVNLPDLAASASEIQVQRGVGTSTNGAGAFGATVNVDLSNVSMTPFAEITNTLGQFGTRKHAIYLGSGGLANNHLTFSGRLSSIRSQGYVDRASARLQATHLTGTYLDDRQSLQMHLLDGQERTYQAWYGLPAQYLDGDSLRTFNVAGTERNGQPHPDEVDNYRQTHYLLHYKLKIAPQWLLQLNGHYTRGKGYFEQYKAGETLTDYGMPALNLLDTVLEQSDLIRRRWLDNHFAGATWALKYQPKRSTFTLGGAANRYWGTHFGEVIWAALATAPNDHRYYDNHAAKNDFNAFVQAETHYNAHWATLLDLQVRHVRYRFLGYDNLLRNVTQQADLLFFNPKAGVSFQINRHLGTYLFGGVGHREPNRDDFTQSSPESRPKAERLYNVETGIKSNGRIWRASANFFGMYYRNQLILSGQINDVGAYTRTNVPESYRAGIELEASVKPTVRWWLTGNMAWSTNQALHFVEYRDNWDTWAQTEYRYNRTPLAFSPNLIARAELGCAILPEHARHALNGTLSGKYISAQYLDNTGNTATQLPAYTFFDARFNYVFSKNGERRLGLILAVNNLLNAQYVSNGWAYRFTSTQYDPRPDDAYTRSEGNGQYHQAGYFPQAGRNWMATAVVYF